MALPLHIPPCNQTPRHFNHPPEYQKPLRICIDGPLSAVQKLAPETEWNLNVLHQEVLQPAASILAKITFEKVYGRPPNNDEIPGDLIIRKEYLRWVMDGSRPLNEIDYYGVTFDHFVPPDDQDPEVLQINITELDYDGGAYAESALPFKVGPAEYTGKKVLAVHRCCQRRKGTTDRFRVNSDVVDKEKWEQEKKRLEQSR
ncbi:hypothetical protein Golomagni_06813 [Golovinomyces magnicellulatus]|nr:hypothetical protein Golomagni_06813 [Golovinomyces magnicellulatus]